MKMLVVALLVYLLVAFICSAVFVRISPHSRVARRLRLNLGMFPLLPAMLLIAGLRAVLRWLHASLTALFVRLSGRQQYRRYDHYYGRRR